MQTLIKIPQKWTLKTNSSKNKILNKYNFDLGLTCENVYLPKNHEKYSYQNFKIWYFLRPVNQNSVESKVYFWRILNLKLILGEPWLHLRTQCNCSMHFRDFKMHKLRLEKKIIFILKNFMVADILLMLLAWHMRCIISKKSFFVTPFSYSL